MATPAEGDPVKRASQEIALMIQRARDDEASKARVLIEKAQWEAEQLRNEGIRVKETLSAEVERLRAELQQAKGGR